MKCTERDHKAAKYHPDLWDKLIPIGIQKTLPTDKHDLEMANCPHCGTTITRKIPKISSNVFLFWKRDDKGVHFLGAFVSSFDAKAWFGEKLEWVSSSPGNEVASHNGCVYEIRREVLH